MQISKLYYARDCIKWRADFFVCLCVNRLWTDRNYLDWTNIATKLLFKTCLCCICCLGLVPDHPKIYLVRTNKGWGVERFGGWHEKPPSKEKHTEICVVSETIRVLGDTKSSHEFE